jgi:hypothetical protein
VAGSIRSIEKSSVLIGTRTRDLPACSIVPQPTTLPRAPNCLRVGTGNEMYIFGSRRICKERINTRACVCVCVCVWRIIIRPYLVGARHALPVQCACVNVRAVAPALCACAQTFSASKFSNWACAEFLNFWLLEFSNI